MKQICKEWLVREDNALAHHLQSKEITEHLQGNRYRNQMIREDFPTALSEQLKEKESAESRAAMYHDMINQQQEADAQLARELEEKMRRRGSNNNTLEFTQSGADHLVKSSNNLSGGNGHLQNELPIPPKNFPKKLTQTASQSNMNVPPPKLPSRTNQINYTTLDFNSAECSMPSGSAKLIPRTNYTEIMPQNLASPTHIRSASIESPNYDHINLQSHTPEKKTNHGQHFKDLITSNSSKTNSYPNDHNFDFPPEREGSSFRNLLSDSANSNHSDLQPRYYSKPTSQLPSPISAKGPSVRYDGAADVLTEAEQFQLLSLEKYDFIMGNAKADRNEVTGSPSRNVRNSIDQFCNIDRIQTMQELGVPQEEILEIDRRITQQERDEEFARQLQHQENKSLTVEEKDRLFAMEAQDKELARMLQERERAKSKRAKERARLRKQQQRTTDDANNFEDDGEASYSVPIDLLSSVDSGKVVYPPTKQEHLSSPTQEPNGSSFQAGSSSHYEDTSNINEENYSSPIDLITSSTQPSGSHLQSGHYRKDDISMARGPNRPTQLDIKGPINRPMPPRFNVPDAIGGNIATVIDPTYTHQSSAMKSVSASPMNPESSSSAAAMLPDYLDKNCSPVPPYMPIQGTRRSDPKKKKSKDKCTHQ